MFPFAAPEPPMRQALNVVRSNLAPLGLAVALMVLSRLIAIATWDPDVKGLTVLAVVEVALMVAAHALATFVGVWSVMTGGRTRGFSTLTTAPTDRVGPFAVYSVIFNLWFLALAAVLVKLAQALVGGDNGLVLALATGVVVAMTAMLMYVQLGLLFPDIAQTGSSSIMFAMALGLSSMRRIIGGLGIPVAAIILPQAVLTELIFDNAGMTNAAAAFPGPIPIMGAILLGVLATGGAVACAVVITRIYQELIPQVSAEAWR